MLIFKLIDSNTMFDIIKYINTDLQNIIQKIIKLYIESNNLDVISHKLNTILIFSTYFKKDNILHYLEIFIKKIKKKNKIDIQQLERCLLDDDLYNNTPIKYINTLINKIVY